jgi:hypothetical protein
MFRGRFLLIAKRASAASRQQNPEAEKQSTLFSGGLSPAGRACIG